MTTMALITAAEVSIPAGVKIEVTPGDRFTLCLLPGVVDPGKSWQVDATNKALESHLAFQVCAAAKPSAAQVWAAMLGDVALSALSASDIAKRFDCDLDLADHYRRMLVGRAEATGRLGLTPLPAWLKPAQRGPPKVDQPIPEPPAPAPAAKRTPKAPVATLPVPPPVPIPPTSGGLADVLNL